MSILTRDCEWRLPREPSHPSGPLPPPAPHPPSRAQRHGPASLPPSPAPPLLPPSPGEAGSGSVCPACSTLACPEPPPIRCWPCPCLPMSLLPWAMAVLPVLSSCPAQEDLPSLSEPRTVTGLGPARHQALSLRARSTVLPPKAGALTLYQEPNHIAALNHHSGLLPRAGSRLGRREGTCPLCTGSTPKSRDQCLDHAFLALRFRFYSLCDCHNPGEK